MSLDELSESVQSQYAGLDEDLAVSLDRETRNELAMLLAATGHDSADELVRRGIHTLFQHTVETGTLDFHLRSGYDVTYDEYLSGLTYDEMTGTPTRQDDDRRYQF